MPTDLAAHARAAAGGARLERDAIAELKARVDLLELAGRHTTLKQRSREWWGCCPIHGERTPSFRVDPQRQTFRCFGCGTHGDAIDFVAAVKSVDTGTAIRRLRDQVGGAPPDPTTIAARTTREAGAAAHEETEKAAKLGLAQEFWRQSGCVGIGPGFTYLTESRDAGGRGISVWNCDRVRFHPACGFGWIDAPPFGFKNTAPAIIVPVTSHATGYVVGIWRIRLTPAGKLVHRVGLGDTKANAARLSEPEGDELAIAEGVEDALAFQETENIPAWAALSAGNMACLILPPRFRRVVIVQDNDPADRHGRRPGPDAAQVLAHRLLAEGREAKIVRAKNAKDPNDVLRARRSAG